MGAIFYAAMFKALFLGLVAWNKARSVSADSEPGAESPRWGGDLGIPKQLPKD